MLVIACGGQIQTLEDAGDDAGRDAAIVSTGGVHAGGVGGSTGSSSGGSPVDGTSFGGVGGLGGTSGSSGGVSGISGTAGIDDAAMESGGSVGTCNPAFCPTSSGRAPCCIGPDGPCGVLDESECWNMEELCLRTAQNACGTCACAHCSGYLMTCDATPDCPAIVACVFQTGCRGTPCSEETACGPVIAALSNATAAVYPAQLLVSCMDSSPCACAPYE